MNPEFQKWVEKVAHTEFIKKTVYTSVENYEIYEQGLLFKQHQKNGMWFFKTYCYLDANLWIIGIFKQNTRIGVWNCILQDKFNRKTTIWNAQYTDTGERIGLWTFFSSDGRVYWKKVYPSIQSNHYNHCDYIDFWFNSNICSEGTFKRPRKYSDDIEPNAENWIFWSDYGNKYYNFLSECESEIGLWKYYFQDGNKKAEGYFDDQRKKTGTWKYYNQEGKITER